jgi:hypothetical protein
MFEKALNALEKFLNSCGSKEVTYDNTKKTAPSTSSADTTIATKAHSTHSTQDVAQTTSSYSPKAEASRILDMLLKLKTELQLPEDIDEKVANVTFTADRDEVVFPIPFKETETTAALKAIEALVASSIADLRYGKQKRDIEINLEQTTCFLFQTYLSSIDGLGKYDEGVKAKLRGSISIT